MMKHQTCQQLKLLETIESVLQEGFDSEGGLI